MRENERIKDSIERCLICRGEGAELMSCSFDKVGATRLGKEVWIASQQYVLCVRFVSTEWDPFHFSDVWISYSVYDTAHLQFRRCHLWCTLDSLLSIISLIIYIVSYINMMNDQSLKLLPLIRYYY